MQDSWKYDLHSVFAPKTIAVVGASDEPGSWADIIYRNILRSGFKGPVFPVHAKRDRVWDTPCRRSVDEISEDVDLAVLLIGNRHILSTLEQCAKKKVKSALVLSSGFAEVKGTEGRELQDRMRQVADEARIRLIGPNCLGAISFVGGLICFAGLVPVPMVPGTFGLVAQSGTFALGFMSAAQTRGLGMSYLVSSGNEAVLDAADYIRFMIEDPRTTVIGAFIEGFRNPRKFIEVADLARERGKPMIVLKVGRSRKARSAAQAHTGSLVGSDDVQRALFQAKGIVRVDTIDEMVDTAHLFCGQRPVHSGGLGVMTLSGGACAMISDYCQDLNIPLPELSPHAREEISKVLPPFGIVDNPLDATGQARMNLDISYRCIDVLLEEKDIDVLLFAISSLQGVTVPNIRKIMEYFAQKGESTGKTVGLLSMVTESLLPEVSALYREIPIPLLQGGRRGLMAVRHLLRYQKKLATGPKPPAAVEPRAPRPESPDIPGEDGGKTLPESEGHRLLAAYGIRSPNSAIVSSVEEAVTAAAGLGYPVALKIDSSRISHKTESKTLALNIPDETGLRDAYQAICERAQRICSRHEHRVLVQEMAPLGVEMIIGVIMDEQFGPAVILGMGGVLVEILKDTAIRLAPIDRADAREMARELAGYRLLAGYRGEPPADLEALAETIVRVSKMALDLKDQLVALDINPLRVLPEGQGVMALDALVQLK
ncbi:MAG: acetate--CoA ligase family protein [Syntrophobacteraceae bacterium]